MEHSTVLCGVQVLTTEHGVNLTLQVDSVSKGTQLSHRLLYEAPPPNNDMGDQGFMPHIVWLPGVDFSHPCCPLQSASGQYVHPYSNVGVAHAHRID